MRTYTCSTTQDSHLETLKKTVVTVFERPLKSQESQIQLSADKVSERMATLLKEFSTSTVYHQWNMAVDEIVGMCMCVLQCS